MATQTVTPNEQKFKIQFTARGQWRSAGLSYFAHGHAAYLTVSTDVGKIVLYGRDNELAKKLREAAHYFDRRIEIQETNLSNITPEAVIKYFYDTPTLVSIAPDVEAVLSPMGAGTEGRDVRAVRAGLDVSALFDSNGRAVRGAQSRIAEVLGISTGGAHRKRILSVLRALQRDYNTSTTEKMPENVDFTEKIAVGA